MPEGLPEVVYAIIHGRFTDDQRKGVFNAEIAVAPTRNSGQDKLLAYTGRDPSHAGGDHPAGSLIPDGRRTRSRGS